MRKSRSYEPLKRLKSIVCATSEEVANLSQCSPALPSAYSEEKGQPATISIRVYMGLDEESGFGVAHYTLKSDRTMIWEESSTTWWDAPRSGCSSARSCDELLLVDPATGLRLPWGKMYRGDKKRWSIRSIASTPSSKPRPSRAARRHFRSTQWFIDQLHILPMGAPTSVRST